MFISSQDFFDNVDLTQKIDSLEFKQVWFQVDLNINDPQVTTTKLESDSPQDRTISNGKDMRVNKSDLQDTKEIKRYLKPEEKGLLIKSHLEVKEYQIAFDTAMKIHELSKKIPLEETESLTSQILRSSRLVCINLAIAYQQKDLNPAIFLDKINNCSLEIMEIQTWIQFAVKSGYIDAKIAQELDEVYHLISKSLVKLLTSHGFFLSFEDC